MTLAKALILITSGFLAGFINTLAGGATVIPISVMIILGLPVHIANGTNRIAVLFQNLVAVRNFQKQNMLDYKKGIRLAIPVVSGSIIGSMLAVSVNKTLLEYTIATILSFMIMLLFLKPETWLKGNVEKQSKPINIGVYFVFFLVGTYGGFIHIGVGFFLLAPLVFLCGFDLVHANAIKNLLVLLYIPFTIIVFLINNQVNYEYGFLLAIGNIIGAYVASQFAVRWGTNFIRWLMIVVIVFSILDLLKILEIRSIINEIL